jgi:outer membrane protein assembly factor BamD
MFRKIALLLFVVAVMTLVSCSQYKQLQKSNDIRAKYKAAVEYYQQEDYHRALQLLDELLIYYRGNDTSEKINYYYAYCYFGEQDYIQAGYYFLKFTTTFPSSQYSEECLYMSAYCQYLFSPEYSLDQTMSLDAVMQLQYFIDRYPNSSRIADCNKLIDEIRAKLELKSFQIAKLYLRTESYQAAVVAFKNLLREYPDTQYREEAYYYIVQASFKYALQSVETKKVTRLNMAVDAYNAFMAIFPESQYKKDVDALLKDINKELAKAQSDGDKRKL